MLGGAAWCSMVRHSAMHGAACCISVSRAAAPAWGCEARLELEAAGSVNRLKASRVGHPLLSRIALAQLFRSPQGVWEPVRSPLEHLRCLLGVPGNPEGC